MRSSPCILCCAHYGRTARPADTRRARLCATGRPVDVRPRRRPARQLSLRTAAEVLGVSIMPVREAVSRLVADKALGGRAQSRGPRADHVGDAVSRSHRDAHRSSRASPLRSPRSCGATVTSRPWQRPRPRCASRAPGASPIWCARVEAQQGVSFRHLRGRAVCRRCSRSFARAVVEGRPGHQSRSARQSRTHSHRRGGALPRRRAQGDRQAATPTRHAPAIAGRHQECGRFHSLAKGNLPELIAVALEQSWIWRLRVFASW